VVNKSGSKAIWGKRKEGPHVRDQGHRASTSNDGAKNKFGGETRGFPATLKPGKWGRKTDEKLGNTQRGVRSNKNREGDQKKLTGGKTSLWVASHLGGKKIRTRKGKNRDKLRRKGKA